jgi:hypothetical protein
MTQPPNPTMKTSAPYMDPDNEAHLQRILERVVRDVSAKYRAGQREHGGHLWEKSGMLEHAIEEVLDLAVYLYTLKEQMERPR